jgi:pimeloyl-ACP methyl ester carboxylesterase
MLQKPPLVLVPGLMCDATVWQSQQAVMGMHSDIHVATHALSDSLGTMAERILATAPRQFALAGHSMGGRVALEVVARAPERVTRLALLDTGYEELPPGTAGDAERVTRRRLLQIARREGLLPMAREWARGMVHPARLADAAFMDIIHQMIARGSLPQFEAQIRALLSRPDRTALLPQISVPTLVLCGHDDSWSPISRHVELASRITGSRLVDVPDCGHMSMMEQPGAITRALTDWLTD